MLVHAMLLGETFVAEFARKPPLFVRVNSTSGRVVTLVVRVELVDAVVVTVADLTHDVTHSKCLKNKITKNNVKTKMRQSNSG